MDWIALYQNPSLWLAQQNLTGEQFKVMLVLFGKLDFDNYLRVSRQDIAEFLNMQPVHVSRAMKKLKELEIVVERPPAGKFKTYRLNHCQHFVFNVGHIALMFGQNYRVEGGLTIARHFNCCLARSLTGRSFAINSS